jgi:hypothetical protein
MEQRCANLEFRAIRTLQWLRFSTRTNLNPKLSNLLKINTLVKPKKPNLSNSLKTKGRVLARFFIENEAEHFIENKRH